MLDVWSTEFLKDFGKKKTQNNIIGECVWKNCRAAIRGLPLRALIAEIQNLKEKGMIQAETPEKEYQRYILEYLVNKEYQEEFARRYPELIRLGSLMAKDTETLVEEIFSRFKKNKTDIVRIFCGSLEVKGIEDVDCMISDSHNHGKRAAKVVLDQGVTLYYKPHGIRKNYLYQEAYSYLCEKVGVPYKKIQYLDCKSYGWEQGVEIKTCEKIAEVKRYYIRMGIHLFLAYILSATDLHGENIIACGEYPVIIDFETFPGRFSGMNSQNVEERIREYLGDSVLQTGILPCVTWGNGKEAVIVSAVNNGEKILTPFRMPVVKNDGTSDIRIEHEPVEMELQGSVPRLNGRMVDSVAYTEEMCFGFSAAYKCFLNDSEVMRRLEPFFEEKARVVLRHTQQYAMYRLTSLHQDVCRNSSDRKALLSILNKDDSGRNREIHKYEIESLLRLDIPYFEIHGKSTSLYDGEGRVYTNYFLGTPYELWKQKLEELGMEDLKRQLSLIHVSMGLLERQNKVVVSKEKYLLKRTEQYLLMKRRIREIAERLCSEAIVTETGIGWIGIQFLNDERWKPVSAGLYLYEGISGVAVFLAAYLEKFTDSQADKTLSRIKRKLFSHTEDILNEMKSATWNNRDGRENKTGILDGEGSIVTAYLWLYRITGEMEYLVYAQKHFLYIEQVWDKTEYFDFLNGNAGAIINAVEIYKITGIQNYLDLAVQMEERLWDCAVKMQNGYGWKIRDMESPLSGMAHGNSGILMAYGELLEVAKKQKYRERVIKVLDYEDSLFSESLGNWLDLRQKDSGKTMNAWCHGAPGILLSRMKLSKVMNSVCVKQDILCAARALFTQNDGRHICLCHGLAGNLLIMHKYLEQYSSVEYQKQYKRLLSDILLNLDYYGKHMAYEYYNPGMMNGITGVGFALLQMLQ